MDNYSKYTFNGWGLSKECMGQVTKIIDDFGLKRALEFGSGQSTYLLEDLNMDYFSLDDNPEYKADSDKVVLTELVKLSDESFNQVINNEVRYVDIAFDFPITRTRHTRQHNCFYDLRPDTIVGEFDLVIVDGPNGNGRSIAFNVIQDHIDTFAYIVIDDYTHYPFVPHLRKIFKDITLVYTGQNPDDPFVIYKINRS